MVFPVNTILLITIGCSYAQHLQSHVNNQLNLTANVDNDTNNELENDPFVTYRNQRILQDMKLFVLERLNLKCQNKVLKKPLEETISEAASCIGRQINFDDYPREFDLALEKNEISNYFEERRDLWHDLYYCITPVYSMVQVCFNSTENGAINILLNILNATNNFIFKNNGTRLQTFVDEGGDECIKNILNHLHCSPSVKKSEIRHMEEMNFFDEASYCRNLKIAHRCFGYKFDECQSKVISNLFNEYMMLVTETACSKATIMTSSVSRNTILLLCFYLFIKMLQK